MKKNATVLSIKKENNGLSSKIKVINFISYIFTTLIMLAVEMRVIEIFDYIENDNHFFLIVLMAIALALLLSLGIYILFVVPVITSMEKKIEQNKYEIYKIRKAEDDEMQSIYNKAKFYALQREIEDIHNS